ncbi:MAG: M23 family metallopeptidase [Mariniphaga sp.]|nr:M23 family metallopeptidase [Mariniphaga sp.]
MGNKNLNLAGKNHWLILCTIFFILFSIGCKEEIVPEAFMPRTEYEAYEHALEQANIAQTALGREWKKAGTKSLKEPIDINLPFEEEFYWNPNSAEATGYSFFVQRGLRIEVEIFVNSVDSLLLFTDLFRMRGDSISEWIHVATADIENHRLEFEPRRDADYVLRIQPELLRGGRFRILIREVPSIGFPVTGKNSRAIQSFFGASRDAGRRRHHGVDIFAARHTSVVAPSNSTVRRVGVGDIGGRYVWLYDSIRSMSLYFAHLETQEVTTGTRVVAGQIIGTVGNTGNAKTTPPHLHFGIYSRGPIDPLHFIAETDIEPDKISGDTLFLGKMVRSKQNVIIKSLPTIKSLPVDTLEKHSMMKVTALAGKFCRVILPNNSSGYIAENQIEIINDPLFQEIATEAIVFLETPDKNAIQMTNIKSGDIFEVLGKYKKFIYGKTLGGRNGWILSP